MIRPSVLAAGCFFKIQFFVSWAVSTCLMRNILCQVKSPKPLYCSKISFLSSSLIPPQHLSSILHFSATRRSFYFRARTTFFVSGLYSWPAFCNFFANSLLFTRPFIFLFCAFHNKMFWFPFLNISVSISKTVRFIDCLMIIKIVD